jgi:hypothetical protein
MYKIELKKIHLKNPVHKYEAASYPESGIYHVCFNDENDEIIAFVDKVIGVTNFITSPKHFFKLCPILEEEEPVPPPGFTFQSVPVPEQSKPEPAFTPDFILELSRILTREKDNKNRFTNP